MKLFKKITSAIIALAMIVTLCAVNPSATEAAVTIRYGKKLTLNIGKTDTIIVKQKGATFKSSNKKIATVSKKGKVKAKKAGTCKITITVGSSKKKATVTVKPAKVAIQSAALASTNSAKVTWKKTKGASGYYVYYSTKKSGGYKKVNVKGAKKTSTTIKNLALGNTYYFKIKAYAKAGKKTITSGSYSAVKSVKTWKMVWNDEFSGTTLDKTKWNNTGATGAGGYGNNELQDYQIDYCEVKNNNLIIKPQFQWNTTTKKAVSNSYYSTKIWTRGQYSVKYGKIEFRAKMPKGQGTWAAAWMLGNNYSWPQCGEIDVLETTSELTKTIIPQSIHCTKFNGMSTSSGNKHWDTKVSDATTAYHTYGVIWTDQTITFTIDGKVTGTYDPNNFVLDGNGTQDSTIWPYNQPFYLILNCAIGGVLGGNVTPTYWTKIKTEGNIETYQDYYYIDWVRVYQ
ncbi:MAG: family 16 glycosylhydrolase [Eubacterium sp.]